MTTVHKIIKYLAMAFAMFLCVSIIGGIITGIAGVSLLLSDRDGEPAGEMQTYPIDGEVFSLSVNLSGAKFQIKTSDSFSVESNHEYISVSLNDGKLCIKETKKPFALSPKGVTVVLNIPEDFVFDEATVETGAGEVNIETLSADVLKLYLGAGEAKIQRLVAKSQSRIDGGAGELTISGGLLCNLNFDMGVGEVTLKSRIEGNSKIDMGVGEINLTLLGSRDDYKIEIDKGIGDANLDGKDVTDGSVYGSGENKIEIDGGVGDIDIDFAEY